MVVELDSGGAWCRSPPESQIRYPAEGAMALDVVEPPVYRIILVPTISRPVPDSTVFDWTDGLKHGQRATAPVPDDPAGGSHGGRGPRDLLHQP